VAAALREDLGAGDVTTAAIPACAAPARGEIVLREPAVVAGLPVAREVFGQLDGRLRFLELAGEGDRLEAADSIARVEGPAAPILAGERTALNFLQRLCGIATLTARFVEAMRGTSCRLLDTRKTAPGLRALDKYAVRLGGGINHRFGLHDGILIKDNHVALAGGLAPAVRSARLQGPPFLKVEVEVSGLAELREALEAGADAVLLDNMDLANIAGAVRIINRQALAEVSGGVTLENAARIAALGVDFISVGELTHSVRAIDIALDLTPLPPESAR
jgi:nicotinate-nucleotide pyrophosphorylase (carboxylating)